MAECSQDIAQFIEDQGHGTQAVTSGWAILLEGLEDSPDTLIVVRSTPGVAAEGQFGDDALRYEHPRLAIWVRAAREDQGAARTKAFAIAKDLGTIQAETVNGTFYNMMLVLQMPWLLKQDARGRPIWVFNVEAYKDVA